MEVIKADTDYAMRMLLQMARHESGQPLPARTLAREQDVPEHFAYKVLNRLTSAGLTRRTMGSRGGFALARSPDRISLLDVAEAIQGRLVTRKCVLNSGVCSRQNGCPVSARLRILQDELAASMGKLTLREIVEGASPEPRSR